MEGKEGRGYVLVNLGQDLILSGFSCSHWCMLSLLSISVATLESAKKTYGCGGDHKGLDTHWRKKGQ